MDLYCVIGFPIGHSLSPKLHNAAFEFLKLDARYEAVAVKPEELEAFMSSFHEKYKGANVTIPHKEAILKYLDEVSLEAAAIGAVNTIVNQNGKLVGHNTDVVGAMEALGVNGEHGTENRKGIVLGAGGAARAIVYGLVQAGLEVTIVNRTQEKAQKLAAEFHCNFASFEDLPKLQCDILINATSVGLQSNKTPIPNFIQLLSGRSQKPSVMDIIYTPRMTHLLRDAQEAGCKIITGDHMFLGQAAAAFELWAREKAPVEIMKNIIQ